MKKYRKTAILAISLSLLLTACQTKKGVLEETKTFIEKTAYDFNGEDKTTIYKWEIKPFTSYLYTLEDGTELLKEAALEQPENVSKVGIEGYDSLKQEVQERISGYYKKRGKIYDITALLKTAYEDYFSCRKKEEDFTRHDIEQLLSPCAETERFIAYVTMLNQPEAPHNHGTYKTTRSCVIFDKESGEVMEAWELFCVPEDEAKDFLISQCMNQEGDTPSYEEIKNALYPERIIWNMDSAEIDFPMGSFANQEYDSCIGLEYENLEEVLYPWAVPSA